MSASKSGKIKAHISIPEYVKHYVDDRLDLTETPKCLCPFHDDGSPSFTYNSDKGLWRCWSKCGGGDVIAMHMLNYHITDRSQAIESLAQLLGIDLFEIDFSEKIIKVDLVAQELAVLSVNAEQLCNGPSDYIALDYIMSQRRPPFEMVEELKSFIEIKGGTTR